MARPERTRTKRSWGMLRVVVVDICQRRGEFAVGLKGEGSGE